MLLMMGATCSWSQGNAGKKPEQEEVGNHIPCDGRHKNKPDGDGRMAGEKNGNRGSQLGNGYHGAESDGEEEA